MTNLTQQPVVVEQKISGAETLAATLHLETCMLRRIPRGSIGKCDCGRTVRAMEAYAEQARIAERERCAKVAGDVAETCGKVIPEANKVARDHLNSGRNIALQIERAIRSGKEPAA